MYAINTYRETQPACPQCGAVDHYLQECSQYVANRSAQLGAVKGPVGFDPQAFTRDPYRLESFLAFRRTVGGHLLSDRLKEVHRYVHRFKESLDKIPTGWDDETGIPFHQIIPYERDYCSFDMFDHLVSIDKIDPEMPKETWWKCTLSDMDDMLFLRCFRASHPNQLIEWLNAHPAMYNDQGKR